MKALPLCLLALAASAAAQPALYRLDPEHSFVHFEVLHFGTSTLRGRFGVSQGEVELDRSAQRGGWREGVRGPLAGIRTNHV